MSTPATTGHGLTCWRIHDDCALRRAAEVLQGQLELTRAAIEDHADPEFCCQGVVGHCYAAARARVILAVHEGIR